MFSQSGNKSYCLIFIKSIVYFERKFVLLLWMCYSDNASFGITRGPGDHLVHMAWGLHTMKMKG